MLKQAMKEAAYRRACSWQAHPEWSTVAEELEGGLVGLQQHTNIHHLNKAVRQAYHLPQTTIIQYNTIQ